MRNLKKSYEITDAEISFVSLVDKAANKRKFLITKAADGKANFQTFGRIIKADSNHHYLTGIVYEPLVEDAHGNFMTEDEIVKAAYWFAKNGDKVDLQHSFEELSEASVVENWVTKSDTTIEKENIKKGTWLMTVEITDPAVWEAVEKKEITGFSMGGEGVYSKEDTDLETIQKDDSKQKKGIIKQLATAFGLDVVEKGAMTDKYLECVKSNNFWSAFNTLEDILRRYNWASDRYEFEEDEDKIREVLSEFNEIVVELLTQKSITKALAGEAKASPEEANIQKAGKSLSQKNKEALHGICESLTTFLKEFDEDEEKKKEEESESDNETEPSEDEPSSKGNSKDEEKKKGENNLKKEEVQSMIEESIKKSMEPLTKAIEQIVKDENQENGLETKEQSVEKSEEVTKEMLAEMVEKSTAAAFEPVTQSIEALLKSRGVPSNLNDEQGAVKKSEEHYLHGLL